MKCESCECETYIIYLNKEHEKVCTHCFRKKQEAIAVIQKVDPTKTDNPG